MPVHALAKAPAGDALKLKPVRIGLYDSYGGSMPSGWTRWLFEQYEMPFQVVYPSALDAGDLKSKFDVLVFVVGATSRRRTADAAAVAAVRRRSDAAACPKSIAACWAASPTTRPCRSSRSSWSWAAPSSPSAAPPTRRPRPSACR